MSGVGLAVFRCGFDVFCYDSSDRCIIPFAAMLQLPVHKVQTVVVMATGFCFCCLELVIRWLVALLSRVTIRSVGHSAGACASCICCVFIILHENPI